MALFRGEMLSAVCDVLHRGTCKHIDTLYSFTQLYSFLSLNSVILLGCAVLCSGSFDISVLVKNNNSLFFPLHNLGFVFLVGKLSE